MLLVMFLVMLLVQMLSVQALKPVQTYIKELLKEIVFFIFI